MWQVFFPRNRTKYRAGFRARSQSNFKCKSHGTTCSALLLDHVANELYVNTRKCDPFVVWNRNLNGGRWHLPILTIWAGMCDLKVWVWAFFSFWKRVRKFAFFVWWRVYVHFNKTWDKEGGTLPPQSRIRRGISPRHRNKRSRRICFRLAFSPSVRKKDLLTRTKSFDLRLVTIMARCTYVMFSLRVLVDCERY